ncbi:MAG: helix-turn-helix domain-containing protein [Candidatus Caldatribacteriota bacterium]|nr:helix-turn-helix domain-containing protein [Candidatus Caldatribacteriota bacterium]
MEKEKQKCKNKSTKYSFTTISDYFLDEWSGVVGIGPTSLYIHLLKYCYKDKNLAWPTLKTLSKKMGTSERSLIRYQKILVKYGFIQNIFKRNTTSRNNIYQLALGQDLIDSKRLPPGMTNCHKSDKMSSSMVTKCQFDSDNMSSCKVPNCHPNNNNLNNNNTTTTRNVVVDFKKDQGEEKMQEIRERMWEFNFTESFIEKVLKEYPVKKIEEKLELYAEGRQVRNPEGFLVAALKEDYGVEIERSVEEASPFRLKMDSRLRRNDIKDSRNDIKGRGNDISADVRLPRRFAPRNDRKENKNILSRGEAIKRIQGIRQNLMTVNS